MPNIYEDNISKTYYDDYQLNSIKNGSGIKLKNIMKNHTTGDGILDFLGNAGMFIKDNKDTINSVVNSAGNLTSTILKTVKDIQEIKKINEASKINKKKRTDEEIFNESLSYGSGLFIAR